MTRILGTIAAVVMTGVMSPVMASDTRAFADTLSAYYMALAGAEAQQGDRRAAETYSRRAQAAATGEPTAPDAVELHRPFLKDKYIGDLTDARARLVAAFENGGRTDAPQAAARAQVSYDCWLEQASENLQQDHIKACKDSFLAAVEEVEAAAVKVVEAPPPPPPPPAPEPEPSYPENFMVFFDFDRAALTTEGLAIVDSAVAAAGSASFKKIVATGHTDRAGSDSYNLRLSQRRADAVRAALEQAGIKSHLVQTDARGESEPLVQTSDGVREPQNRRVEILIQR